MKSCRTGLGGINTPNDPNANVIYMTIFLSGYAIDLARAMITILPPILRDVLDALGFEKWAGLKRIANMEIRWRRDEVEADKVIDALNAKYSNEFYSYVNKSGKYLAVTIPMYVFENTKTLGRRLWKYSAENTRERKMKRRDKS